MREIKFRAWWQPEELEYHRGKVTNPPRMLQVGDNTGTTHPLDCCNYARQGQNVTLMQFTGLKDKNGKEIFEGDIVQEFQMRFENDDDEDWKLLPYDKPDIVTMDRFPVYWLERESFGYEGEDLKSPDDFEVIGNIYENPELLEVTR